jgi:DNA-binding transcriptional ArsR family regulator
MSPINSREEVTYGELVSCATLAPATISHHPRVLLEAGLIETLREGQFVCSKANPQTIEEFTEALSALGKERKK